MNKEEFLKEKDLLLNSIENNTKEHWENYYKGVPIECIYDDLVIDINEIKRLTEENKELKELIDTILNWNIFKNECPMNFGYDEETNEDKSQSVFYEDEYCENACNDDYRKCWLKYFEKMQELERDGKNE